MEKSATQQINNNIQVYGLNGSSVSTFAIPNNFLVQKINSHLVFEQVIAENAASRQGTHSTLKKGEVRGGGKKPRPQKHTGGARQGSTRNPHWVGGGVAFGPKPNKNYKLYINAKASQNAFYSSFCDKLVNNSILGLQVSDTEKLSTPSTKTFVSFLKAVQLVNKKVLFISGDKNLLLSSRNILNVISKNPKNVSVKDIVSSSNIVLDINVFNNEWKENK